MDVENLIGRMDPRSEAWQRVHLRRINSRRDIAQAVANTAWKAVKHVARAASMESLRRKQRPPPTPRAERVGQTNDDMAVDQSLPGNNMPVRRRGPRGTRRNPIRGKKGGLVKSIRRKRKKTKPKGTKTTSIMSGFVKSYRKKRETVLGKLGRKGSVYCVETGGTQTSFNATTPLYVGHASAPMKPIIRAVWAGILKEFFRTKHQCDVGSLNATLSLCGLARPTNLTIEFFVGNAIPAVNSTFQMTNVHNSSIDGLAQTIYSHFTSNYRDAYVQFTRLIASPVNGSDNNNIPVMRLTGASVYVYSKASLKIQNITKSDLGSADMDEVDRVPLYGKTYQRNGTAIGFTGGYLGGVLSNGPQLSSEESGLLSFQFPNSATQLTVNPVEEPPPPEQLQAKSSGKISLDPGAIKTSTLTFSKWFKLDTLMNNMKKDPFSNYNFGDAAWQYGKVRLMILERVIAANLADQKAKVQYEHDIKVGSYVKLKQTTYSDMVKVQYEAGSVVPQVMP